MTTPPELNPDPLQVVVAELSKRIETHQREDIAALR